MHEEMNAIIQNTQANFLVDYEKEDGKQAELREECKRQLLTLVESPKFQDLQNHQIPGTVLGRYLYNAIIALPVGVYKLFSTAPASSFFYHTKTKTGEAMDEITEDISNLTEPVKR